MTERTSETTTADALNVLVCLMAADDFGPVAKSETVKKVRTNFTT